MEGDWEGLSAERSSITEDHTLCNIKNEFKQFLSRRKVDLRHTSYK